MRELKGLDTFRLGACYYPEHWPESMWEDDFQRMRELGLSVIRVAEFAWSVFEPEEGVFRFELFDKAIDLAHKHGLKVIIGTPTATAPVWLTHKYPETLAVTYDGVTLQPGMRQHTNYSSPVYREFSARITRRMAEHYKDHPAVIGWQLDNEFHCEKSESYAEADHLAFRNWLKNKYDGSLDALNDAWGTRFWNQTYTDWEQVFLPRPTPAPRQCNPHQVLDQKRFLSDNTISFARIQADIIREVAPHHWITTNGIFGRLDNHRMTEELLDFFSYDSYPQFSTIFHDEQEEKPLLDRKWVMGLATTRSVSPNFCIMEQQSGPGGWVNRMDMPSPKPGQMRLWTYQSIAHGADMVLFFRWRTATVGTELYWHGLNDYHNRPNRRIAEAGRIGKELQEIGNRIIGSRYQAEVAILRDYENEWDGEYDMWHGPFTYKSQLEWTKALQYRHIPNDHLFLRRTTTLQDLQRYKALIYPHPAIMRDETAALLAAYAEQGGILIFGCRTGYKNEHGHAYMKPFPGAAAELCGITVEEFTRIKGTRKPVRAKWNDNASGFMAGEFNEVLAVERDDVDTMAVYDEEYYAGKPAVTRRRVGAGQVWYFGAVFSERAADHLLGLIGMQSPAAEWASALPEQVELAIRRDEQGREIRFLLNYNEDPAAITLSKPQRDLLTGETLSGEIKLEGFGVFVLCEESESR
ncbi:beta-galactosidase [Paenibacillus thailandensis]|uniref:Beta-galactosidase n=1 Tax=Paenibacillus thailandensis TaxID=393250 RepID=A0ABW5R0I0_9BACL